jgi:formiminoglutamase
VFSVLKKGGIPFVVGGSNDQSSSNGKALLDFLDLKPEERGSKKDKPINDILKTATKMGLVNIDAHLDVRPRVGEAGDKIHSGCPFRDLLEDPRFSGTRFVEFAAQGSQCSAEHARYVEEEQKGKIYWFTKHLRDPRRPPVVTQFAQMLEEDLIGDKNKNAALFVSFDIDSISGADCPGVSCPGTIGLSAEEALGMSMEAGKNPNTVLFDLSEMNVAIEDYRTPRLAVNMFYFFLLGYKMRKSREALI